jgi:ATP-dependent RNA helicase DeaD
VANTFRELGLSEPLAAAVEAAGYDRPSPLQDAAFAVLRRGGNAVLHASSGAGVMAAFGVPLLDRLAEQPAAGVRALVVAPSEERAERVARTLAELATDSGVAVRSTAPGWRVQGAAVLVTSAQRALEGVQSSTLKLEELQALVVVDAAELFALGGADALGTLLPLVPRDAQRIIVTAQLGPELEHFIEAHARRALTVPARAADPQMAMPQQPAGQIGYMVVAETEKPEMLARLLEGANEGLVFARTAARAAEVLRELARRGVTDADALQVRAVAFDAQTGGSGRIVSYDVPFAADELKRLHATGGTVLVTPAELTHFRRIAAEALFTLKQRRARELDATDLSAYRDTVRSALETEDLAAQLMVLDPLFEDSSPAEVAAALSALLRRRAPTAAPAATGSAGRVAAATAPTGAAPKEAVTGAFTRLFLSIGTRDNVRAGDIVGAITGEAGIKGDQVGRVDIRDSFTVVEVAGNVAEKVIRALNGTTMRGRSLRVDFDRKTGSDSPRDGARSARGPGGSGAGGSGRGPGGPPRGPRRDPPRDPPRGPRREPPRR